MKKINARILNARSLDLEGIVTNANYLEHLSNQGKSSEDVINLAKGRLGLTADQSVIAEATEKLTHFNKVKKALIDVNSLKDKLANTDLLKESDKEVLDKLEATLADEIKDVFDLEDEDLYEEE